MNISKNYIDKNHANQICDIFLSNMFPWYYIPNHVDKESLSYMSHTFFKDGQATSNAMFLVEPILKKLKVKNILNVRANLCFKRPSKFIWHVDKFTDNLNHKTAIYYVNTNNGCTEFKDKKVKCEKNKIVIFDSKIKHRAKIQTDTDTRMVINFNYEYI